MASFHASIFNPYLDRAIAMTTYTPWYIKIGIAVYVCLALAALYVVAHFIIKCW